MPLNVGSRLGHYDVTALIGEGGMGQVYQATDTKLNRQVALKRLKPSLPILFGFLGSSERPGWLSTRAESATYQRDKGACNSHAVSKMSPRPGTI